jgi:hypothetical protein
VKNHSKEAISNRVNILQGDCEPRDSSMEVSKHPGQTLAGISRSVGVSRPPSDFAGSSGDSPISVIGQYIEQQQTPGSRQLRFFALAIPALQDEV